MLKRKYERLKKVLNRLGSGIIAFSGGVDSSVLAKVAYNCIGRKVMAVTAHSPSHSSLDCKEAKIIAKEIGIDHRVIFTQEFKNDRFINNKDDRCYWCKRELFSQLKNIVSQQRYKVILDGTNYDDSKDIRPGLKANKEFGIISPLYEIGFTKKEVVQMAKYLGLSLWSKPKNTCLVTRIPLGEKITLERIKRIDKAEDILRNFLGKGCLFRARDHNDILRVESEKDMWTKLKNSGITIIIKKLKKLGYKYITFDWEGYIPAGKRIRA